MSDADRDRWNLRWRARADDDPETLTTPAASVSALDAYLPRSGRALDLAGGAGRHALWLAARGLTVTLADVSDAGLELAEQLAASSGLELETRQLDLDADPIPAGPWQLVLVHYFLLDRAQLSALVDTLAPGGTLVWIHPTVRNLERHARPSARWLLPDDVLEAWVAELPLDVQRCDASWRPNGHHEVHLLARSRVESSAA